MAKLSAGERKALPTNTFAVPSKAPGSGSFPIPDKAHARAALRLEHNAPPSERPAIERKARAMLSDHDADDRPGAKRVANDHDADDPPRKRQVYKVNRQTAAHGVPQQTGRGERQLDGTRTPTYSPPVQRQPLAERQPAPHRSSGGSGLEAAMGDLADKLHPRSGKRR